MRLLVTGGCGFIGAAFINKIYLHDPNCIIVNMDAMYYCADESRILPVIRNSPRYYMVKGNINSVEFVDYLLREHEITHVIHFAAQSHVQRSFDNSIQFTMDNVYGTHVLLESVRNYGKICKFIHVSTDEVYGESMLFVDEQHKTEHSILCPTNPYAATKAAAELIAQSYWQSYKVPIIITRGNNVYGPNQYPEKLIPRFIKLLKSGNPVTIQGDGSALRSFMYIDDAVSAFIHILEKGTIGEIYNIGCDEGMEYSVSEVAHLLINKIIGTTDYDKWITYIPDRPFNDKRYYISNEKIKQLGWCITTQLNDGLDSILNVEQLY